MFQVRVGGADSLTLIGTAIDANQAIPVDVGWNWIGFLPDRGLATSAALASIEALNGDVLKSPDNLRPVRGWCRLGR